MDEQSEIKKVANDKNHTFNIPSSGVYTNHKGGGSKPLLIGLGVIVILLIVGTAFLLRGNFTMTNQPAPTPTPGAEAPVAIETEVPLPTPKALDRSQYTVKVLNGTKKVGLAATASTKLNELGYKTDKTGNATNSAFLNTVVRVKANATELMDQIIKDLAPDFAGAIGETSLKESEKIDAEIILGGK
jgi:hypothetical protein